jgi:membrane associated rhomboid family serine protease
MSKRWRIAICYLIISKKLLTALAKCHAFDIGMFFDDLRPMADDKKRLIYSTIPAILFVILLWVIEVFEWLSGISLSFLGVYPLEWSGLIGIIGAPLVHSDFSHLAANSVPLLVLGSALFYFYRPIAYKVFIWGYILTGLWVWVFAREAYHIGASGVVNALAAFIFFSGLIRRNTRLIALAMVIAFLYGSLIWGVFPEFFPEDNISWESHFMGLLAGTLLAFYFRKEGPQRERYSWEYEEEDYWADEEDEDEDEDENAYWRTTISDEEVKNIRRVYRFRRR